MSNHIYAETIKVFNHMYDEEYVTIITSNLCESAYANERFWLVMPDAYIVQNDGYKRIDL